MNAIKSRILPAIISICILATWLSISAQETESTEEPVLAPAIATLQPTNPPSPTSTHTSLPTLTATPTATAISTETETASPTPLSPTMIEQTEQLIALTPELTETSEPTHIEIEVTEALNVSVTPTTLTQETQATDIVLPTITPTIAAAASTPVTEEPLINPTNFATEISEPNDNAQLPETTPEVIITITPTATLGGISLVYVQGVAVFQNRVPDNSDIEIHIIDMDTNLLSVARTDTDGVYTVAVPSDAPYWFVAMGALHKRVTILVKPDDILTINTLLGGDLNSDNCISYSDIGIMLQEIDQVGSIRSDINNDGITDISDFAILTGNFEPDCEVPPTLTPSSTPEGAATAITVTDAPPSATATLLPSTTQTSTEQATIFVKPTETQATSINALTATTDVVTSQPSTAMPSPLPTLAATNTHTPQPPTNTITPPPTVLGTEIKATPINTPTATTAVVTSQPSTAMPSPLPTLAATNTITLPPTATIESVKTENQS